MENNSRSALNFAEDVDVNNPDFYDSVHNEIESDSVKLMKTLEVIDNLRMEAAELEIETAQLYHAELWYVIEDLKAAAGK